MLKIVIVGNGPLPDEKSKSRPAAGLRTYQFLTAIRESGLAFNLSLIKIAMPECYDEVPIYSQAGGKNGCKEFTISKNDSSLTAKLQKIIDEISPDVLISVNTYPSYLASKLKFHAAFWVDLNGWIMAEGAIQASVSGTNAYLPHYYRMEKSILKKADKISTVSASQRGAVLGELAFLGRINKDTATYNFIEYIPNAAFAEYEEAIESEEIRKKMPKEAFAESSFICLWGGGYNTWADEETLFKGLEIAMREDENVYFVSTGGEISGLENRNFENFKKMIDGSKFKERFVFLGWIDTKYMPYVYQLSDIGLNVDLNCVETYTGARNRINEMMKYGLPVLTTFGSEIASEVEKSGAGVGVFSGDFEALGTAILKFAKMGNDERAKFGEAGRRYTKENNYEKVMEPLMKWLREPGHAPDNGKVFKLDGFFSRLASGLRYLREKGLKKFLQRLFR
ncbi:hypothetical protein HY604_04785 [Candidatus Peregrinibacteria bacterium]|nr:hypothetical protein [Candidatus Peregrinibacteria bacterium]